MMNVVKITAGGEFKSLPANGDNGGAWGVAKRELNNATLEPLALGKGLVMMLDEDGYAKGLPMNERATAIVAKCYGVGVRPIQGDVVICVDNGATYKPLTDSLEVLVQYWFHWMPKLRMPSKMPAPTIQVIAWK